MKIIVRIYGGLGNQLFQYAFGRSLQEKTKCKLYFDTTTGFKDDFFKRSYKLNSFSVIGEEISRNSFKLLRLYYQNEIARKLIKKVNKYIPSEFKWYFKEKRHFSFQDEVYKVSKDAIFDGYWQNINYFDSIKGILQQEITVRKKLPYEVHEYSKLLTEQCSVAVHVRYPHKYSNGNVSKTAENRYVVLEQDYYKKAFELISSQISSPKFYVFSDNQNWAKSLLNFRNNLNYVDFTKTEIEDFYLMQNCHHFIISNSTFSWWPAYLGKAENKIVISPKKWFHDKDLLKGEFFPSDWNLI